MKIKKRELLLGLTLVLLIGAISVALALQGWKFRAPAFDLLTYIYSIRRFLEMGVLPQHGDTGSYGSYKPAGTAWLMLPGAILFKDPRLSESAGAAILHFSTLLAIFILARRTFSLSCACLAVLLYGLSDTGLFLAGSLWPNGRPDFYIWVVLLAGLWIARKQVRYLAAALAVWGIGMQVDMGITPAIFIIPAAWLIYQPPIRLKPLLVAGVIVLVAWSPYLRFEATRGFVDIRSQLLQQPVPLKNYLSTWCDPNLAIRHYEQPVGFSTAIAQVESAPLDVTGPVQRFLTALENAKEKLLSNFEAVESIPGAGFLLFLLTLGGLLPLSVTGTSAGKDEPFHLHRFFRSRITMAALGMVFCAMLLAVLILASHLLGLDGFLRGSKISFLQKLLKILALFGIALLVGPMIAAAANRISQRSKLVAKVPEPEQSKFLVISLLIPWSILFLLAEPGKPERFWWLWPLQILFLAAFLTHILPLLRIPRTMVFLAQIGITLFVIVNLTVLSHVRDWLKNGWAGPDAQEVQVVDYVAQQIKAEGKDRAAIGYQTFIYPFMARYNITNPVYKVGAEYDIFFRYRHNIKNEDSCPEGFSPKDDYRIVQLTPKEPIWSPRDYFSVPPDSHYYLLGQIGPYQVLKVKGQ